VLPHVIIHNSVSLDGSLTNFEPNMETHYRIAGEFKAEVHLIGSVTAKVGVEMFGGCPAEEERDFKVPKRDPSLPLWVIVDTKGSMYGMLHVARRFEYAKDVVVLISESTPEAYLEYLKERKYPFLVAGEKQVDLRRSLELLTQNYDAKKVMTDTGSVLSSLLIEQHLASEISLLVHPIVVGGNLSYNMFSKINKSLTLKLEKVKSFDGGLVWLLYQQQTT
jgi:2,5-diamino-6-(ribosylamino)-4(3H)-pyrimidinone 5'-phosphate reductase